MENDRYRVKSVDRAVTVLEALGEAGGDGLTVSDVGKALGVSKSTAFALLATLLDRGFVADSGEGASRRYRLGMALARLGDRVVAQTGVRDVAMPVLRELTDATGLTSRLAVLEDGLAVVIGRVDAPGAVRFTSQLGQRELPHSSGVGKALLATLPEDRVREIVTATGMPRRTDKTLTDLDVLLRDLAGTRDRGYAVDDEEDAEGVFCVGSAVMDHTGRCVGAISVTGIKRDMPSWQVALLGTKVREHAAQVSARLGAPA
jgi:IclR family acetate operon transcriptional repressor